MSLTSKDRVLAAINFTEPDRVPIILGETNATGIKQKPHLRLQELTGIKRSEDQYLYDWPELGTAKLDEKLLERLGSDVRSVTDLEPIKVRELNQNRPPHSPYVDSWGVKSTEIQEGVWFPSIHPLAEATTVEEMETYTWPDMDDPTRISHIREKAKALYEENEYAIIGAPWLLFPFERAFALQGMDKFLMNMVKKPDFAEELLKKNAEMCKALMGNFLREAGEYLDIIKIGDDLGMQTSLMISPKMYREILKPIHADYIAFIKERTKAKVFFHTDGDVFDLIEDFIEIGIDILNPIQTSAGKMANLEDLKKCFGKRIVFCGGIDTHHILPFGTMQEVRQEVHRVIDILAPGGGYMVSSVHTIMDDVPAENILALVDAVQEFGQYNH